MVQTVKGILRNSTDPHIAVFSYHATLMPWQPVEGRVVEPADVPCSYIMENPSGEVRRNRSQLNGVPEHSSTVEPEMGSSPTSAREQPRRIVTRSQTGTAIRPLERLF